MKTLVYLLKIQSGEMYFQNRSQGYTQQNLCLGKFYRTNFQVSSTKREGKRVWEERGDGNKKVTKYLMTLGTVVND